MREVEEKSSHLAQRWSNPTYRTSASWLDRVERNGGVLSATKLLVLAVVYGLSAEQILGLHPFANEERKPLDQLNQPNATVLLQGGPIDDIAKDLLPEKLILDTPPEATALISHQDNLPAHYSRGIIGRQDRTLDPMIRPGSIVLIDTKKRTIANRRQWTHEFDRPIYFLMTRTGYASGFCELDKASEWLTLVPHPLSYEVNKRWLYRKEIEVVGTVAAVFTRRVES